MSQTIVLNVVRRCGCSAHVIGAFTLGPISDMSRHGRGAEAAAPTRSRQRSIPSGDLPAQVYIQILRSQFSSNGRIK